MILKAEEIADLLDTASQSSDPLLIAPEPNIEELRESGSASIDLRLGTWFVTLRQSRLAVLRVTDDSEPPPNEHLLTKGHYVPFGSDFIVHPRNFVLGTSLEWLRLPKDLACYIVGRSSWGRRGLIIATASGVHPGFTGCLTLEIANIGEIPIAIRPGMAICQLFIHGVREKKLGHVDRSMFVGRRKPTLGTIELDEVTQKLSRKQSY